jgi:hypothetical protein
MASWNATKRLPLLIDGKFVQSKATKFIEVFNPATQKVVTEVRLDSYMLVKQFTLLFFALFFVFGNIRTRECSSFFFFFLFTFLFLFQGQ